jgi:hypothetical protein
MNAPRTSTGILCGATLWLDAAVGADVKVGKESTDDGICLGMMMISSEYR